MPPDILCGRKVLLCLTGSVAGIKVGELVTVLQGAGAEVQLASSAKGEVFLRQSQQELPAQTPCHVGADAAGAVRF